MRILLEGGQSWRKLGPHNWSLIGSISRRVYIYYFFLRFRVVNWGPWVVGSSCRSRRRLSFCVVLRVCVWMVLIASNRPPFSGDPRSLKSDSYHTRLWTWLRLHHTSQPPPLTYKITTLHLLLGLWLADYREGKKPGEETKAGHVSVGGKRLTAGLERLDSGFLPLIAKPCRSIQKPSDRNIESSTDTVAFTQFQNLSRALLRYF